MRLLLPCLLLLSCTSSPSSSCVTNGDCEDNNCVNGTCVPAVDSGTSDAGLDVPDVAERDSAPDPDASACVPWTCETLGQVCRPADDGCGGRLECGTPGTTEHAEITWGATPYANWNFGDAPQRSIRHTLCFDEIPSEANGFGLGMYFQLYGGRIDGEAIHYGFRDRVADLGNMPGVVFQKYEDNDATHMRGGPNTVLTDVSQPGIPVGLRMPLTFAVGCYEARLEITEAAAGGDWVDLTVSRAGTDFYVGGLWFPRTAAATPVSFSTSGGTWSEFFGFTARTSDEMPRYDFRVRAWADDMDPRSIGVQYHERAGSNTSCEYLAASEEVRFLVGGDTFRCVPGELVGELFEHVWMLP